MEAQHAFTCKRAPHFSLTWELRKMAATAKGGCGLSVFVSSFLLFATFARVN